MIRTLLVSDPATEPVSLAEAKTQLRIDGDEHNALISSLITTARLYLEEILGRAMVTQTRDLYLDAFSDDGVIELPRAPLQSVTGVYYTPDGGTEVTYSASSYVVDAYSEPGRIIVTSGSSWPGDTLINTNGVRIRHVCGYGEAADVPAPLRQAILLLVGQWFDNPVTYEVGPVMSIPFAVDALIAPYRVWSF